MVTTESSIEVRIEHALESIRGYLQTDGGDVRVHAMHDDGTLELEFLGACSSCSMSPMTLKAGIEQAVMKSVPEVLRIRTIGDWG